MSVFEGEIRKISKIGTGGDHKPSLDEYGNSVVSMGLPPYARLAAAGKLFVYDMHAGTAKAPVVAMPTTSPEWGLYNASPTDTCVVLQIGCSLKSGTAGLGLALVCAAAKGPQTVVSSAYTSSIVSCCDGSQRTPDAFLTNNPTLIGGTPAWHVWDATEVNTVATDSVGDGLVADIQGALVARPNGGMVAWEVVGETGTTALFSVSVLFAMLDLERY